MSMDCVRIYVYVCRRNPPPQAARSSRHKPEGFEWELPDKRLLILC